MCGYNNVEIHGRFDGRLVACALQWRMSINLEWLVMSKFFVVIWWSWSRGNGRNGILSNWYDSKSSSATERNNGLGRGAVMQPIWSVPASRLNSDEWNPM